MSDAGAEHVTKIFKAVMGNHINQNSIINNITYLWETKFESTFDSCLIGFKNEASQSTHDVKMNLLSGSLITAYHTKSGIRLNEVNVMYILVDGTPSRGNLFSN